MICETCGLSVPPDTAVCPRDGTVVLSSFHVPGGAREEPKVVVHASSETVAADAGVRDPLIGLRLGEYELRSRIGVGGMGLVYEGIQPLIGKRVAVKVLRPELAHSSEQVERLLAEARAVNAIRHRGIIDIFGFGQVPDGRQYIIMEYLEGQALDAVLAEKHRLPVQETLSLLDEVLAALAAAHGAGVVHRDLKPSNIFLVRQPDGSRYVKVLDFGLAKRAQTPTGRSAQTRTDMVVGTPEYMAPEQARGQEVGPMTDLYALGVVAFEAVTGRLPFIGASPVDLLMKHVEARPPRPSEFVPELPPALDAFILQMLTKDPETRPNSADALRQQLNKLRRTLRSTRSNPSAPAPVEKPRGRDDVESRRPTTPVPVPPELNTELTSQELRAAGVSVPKKGGRRVPVAAAAIGAAVLLVGAGAAIVVRGSPETPTPPPAQAKAPEVKPTAVVPTAPAAPAVEPPVAGAPAAVAPAAPSEATAALGTAGTVAPTAAPAVADAALTPKRAATQGKPSQDEPEDHALAPATARTTSRKKTRAPSSEDVAPEPTDTETRGSYGSAPRTTDLHRRIDDLEIQISTRSTAGKIEDDQMETAFKMLDRYRAQAKGASPEQRKKISDGLDYFERTFLK
ncbi:serine/threonine protein kinase [Pyxidicoccus fallax]|uniref:non-specific serine/threonine protein kinase n=1 Tax=Pyxidicoccus fallax TaxID=394095 RepID=A0A848LYK0_9BACT|nr:serine/threonine protein kinase [Pyxidicoccus fallax]NPC85923.1 serine/threonine protein kinase [Pyxidicoccus fallax]